MKTVFAAALLLALPGMASAQTTTSAPAQPGAAATLPNTFDTPTAAPAPRPQAAAPAAAAAASDPAKVAAAEAMLRKTIAAMAAGTPNYDDMTADLAAKVREQSTTILSIFPQLGALQALTHSGHEDGAELFLVVFANAPTQWIIAQNEEGKIVALLFRAAPPPGA